MTAKLSKKFYDALGDDVVNELVEWFNHVDATYRADLRELNDLNFNRFDAKMGQRLAELETKIERRLAESEAKMEKGLNALRTEMLERMEGLVASRMDGLVTRMDGLVGRTDGLESRVERLGTRMEGLGTRMEGLVTREELAAFRAEMFDKFNGLLRWMIVLWSGTVLAVITATVFG